MQLISVLGIVQALLCQLPAFLIARLGEQSCAPGCALPALPCLSALQAALLAQEGRTGGAGPAPCPAGALGTALTQDVLLALLPSCLFDIPALAPSSFLTSPCLLCRTQRCHGNRLLFKGNILSLYLIHCS